MKLDKIDKAVIRNLIKQFEELSDKQYELERKMEDLKIRVEYAISGEDRKIIKKRLENLKKEIGELRQKILELKNEEHIKTLTTTVNELHKDYLYVSSKVSKLRKDYLINSFLTFILAILLLLSVLL